MAPRGTLGAAHVRELAEVGHRQGPAAPLERGDSRELILQAEPHAAAALHGMMSGELRPRVRRRPLRRWRWLTR
eukprot:2401944-Alexandrium_andersonii.AAC.1